MKDFSNMTSVNLKTGEHAPEILTICHNTDREMVEADNSELDGESEDELILIIPKRNPFRRRRSLKLLTPGSNGAKTTDLVPPKSQNNPISLFVRMSRTHRVWCCPTMNRETVEHLLRSADTGNFIVRLSKEATNMVVSRKTSANSNMPNKKEIQHLLINVLPRSGYILAGDNTTNLIFPSLIQLLCFYHRISQRKHFPFIKLPHVVLQAQTMAELDQLNRMGTDLWIRKLPPVPDIYAKIRALPTMKASSTNKGTIRSSSADRWLNHNPVVHRHPSHYLKSNYHPIYQPSPQRVRTSSLKSSEHDTQNNHFSHSGYSSETQNASKPEQFRLGRTYSNREQTLPNSRTEIGMPQTMALLEDSAMWCASVRRRSDRNQRERSKLNRKAVYELQDDDPWLSMMRITKGFQNEDHVNKLPQSSSKNPSPTDCHTYEQIWCDELLKYPKPPPYTPTTSITNKPKRRSRNHNSFREGTIKTLEDFLRIESEIEHARISELECISRSRNELQNQRPTTDSHNMDGISIRSTARAQSHVMRASAKTPTSSAPKEGHTSGNEERLILFHTNCEPMTAKYIEEHNSSQTEEELNTEQVTQDFATKLRMFSQLSNPLNTPMIDRRKTTTGSVKPSREDRHGLEPVKRNTITTFPQRISPNIDISSGENEVKLETHHDEDQTVSNKGTTIKRTYTLKKLVDKEKMGDGMTRRLSFESRASTVFSDPWDADYLMDVSTVPADGDTKFVSTSMLNEENIGGLQLSVPQKTSNPPDEGKSEEQIGNLDQSNVRPTFFRESEFEKSIYPPTYQSNHSQSNVQQWLRKHHPTADDNVDNDAHVYAQVIPHHLRAQSGNKTTEMMPSVDLKRDDTLNNKVSTEQNWYKENLPVPQYFGKTLSVDSRLTLAMHFVQNDGYELDEMTPVGLVLDYIDDVLNISDPVRRRVDKFIECTRKTENTSAYGIFHSIEQFIDKLTNHYLEICRAFHKIYVELLMSTAKTRQPLDLNKIMKCCLRGHILYHLYGFIIEQMKKEQMKENNFWMVRKILHLTHEINSVDYGIPKSQKLPNKEELKRVADLFSELEATHSVDKKMRLLKVIFELIQTVASGSDVKPWTQENSREFYPIYSWTFAHAGILLTTPTLAAYKSDLNVLLDPKVAVFCPIAIQADYLDGLSNRSMKKVQDISAYCALMDLFGTIYWIWTSTTSNCTSFDAASQSNDGCISSASDLMERDLPTMGSRSRIERIFNRSKRNPQHGFKRYNSVLGSRRRSRSNKDAILSRTTENSSGCTASLRREEEDLQLSLEHDDMQVPGGTDWHPWIDDTSIPGKSTTIKVITPANGTEKLEMHKYSLRPNLNVEEFRNIMAFRLQVTDHMQYELYAYINGEEIPLKNNMYFSALIDRISAPDLRTPMDSMSVHGSLRIKQPSNTLSKKLHGDMEDQPYTSYTCLQHKSSSKSGLHWWQFKKKKKLKEQYVDDSNFHLMSSTDVQSTMSGTFQKQPFIQNNFDEQRNYTKNVFIYRKVSSVIDLHGSQFNQLIADI